MLIRNNNPTINEDYRGKGSIAIYSVKNRYGTEYGKIIGRNHEEFPKILKDYEYTLKSMYKHIYYNVLQVWNEVDVDKVMNKIENQKLIHKLKSKGNVNLADFLA